MDPAGLAVGVAGLAGVFTTCVDLLSRVQKYKSFKSDSRILNARFASAKFRFETWGSEVGVDKLRNDKLAHEQDENNHPALRDPRVRVLVKEYLGIVEEFFGSDDLTPESDASRPLPAPSQSKRRRFAWALGGKEIRQEQVVALEALIQSLHDHVPPDGKSSINRVDKADLPSVEDVRAKLTEIINEATLTQRREVFRWLNNPSSNQDLFHESLTRRVAGTCGWVTSRPAFVEWHSPSATDSSPRILWIHGPGGFGKTIMCASLAKTLESEPETTVVSYFFSSSFESREDPSLAVRSWTEQLIRQDDHAFDIACERRQKDDNITISRSSIYELFTTILQNTRPCILVVDGVDECTSFTDGEPNSAVSFLQDVTKALSQTKSKLLVVSRGLSAIRQALEPAPSGFVEHTVTESDVKSDNAAVSKDLVNRRLKNRTPEDRDLISGILLDRCQGQFLWVRLQETKLRGAIPMVRKGLENTPADLNKIYDREWSRIENLDKHLRDWAIPLLRWTACASRPLTVAETTGAIKIDSPVEELETYTDCIDEEYVNEMIRDICGSLVDVHCEKDDTTAPNMTLRIPHFTIRQYLIGRLPCPDFLLKSPFLEALKDDERQHTLLAESCLRYLNNPLVWKTPDANSALTWIRDYASLFWESHAQRGWRQDLTDLAVDLITASGTQGWRRQIEQEYKDSEESETSDWAPVAHAVRLGLTDVLLSLIGRKGCHVDQPTPNTNWTTPLNYACLRGSMSIVETLLDNEADISGWSTNTGSQAIDWAARGGKESIVRLLLSRGAAVDSKRRDHTTPLEMASLNGHDAVVRLLLERGADPSNTAEDGATPLGVAAQNGHGGIVELLLDAGAACNASYFEATALYCACSSGHLDVVNLLLERGADTSIPYGRGGWSPLMVASDHGHLEVVDSLLSQKADVTFVTVQGITALDFAALKGHMDIVELLIRHEARLDARNHFGSTPLSLAADQGHTQIVRFLLAKGATADTYNVYIRSPLYGAAFNAHTKVVKLLAQEHSTSISMKDLYGCTALWAAASEGHHEVVKVLLQYDEADVEAENESLWSSVLVAANNGHAETLKLLMANPLVRCDHADIWGRTALSLAAANDHRLCVQALLEDGRSDANAQNHWKQTPLMLAAGEGHHEVVAAFLALAKLNLSSQDEDGDTALHCAAMKGRTEVIRKLLDDGRSDINARNQWKQTPLMLAAAKGHVECVCDLLGDCRIEPETRDLEQWSAFMYAANRGQSSVATQLLADSRVQVDGSDAWGRTALCFASRYGCGKTVQALLADERSTPTNRNWCHLTPLFAAVANGHHEVVKMLLDYTESLKDQGGFGRDLLWWARRSGNVEVERALILFAGEPPVTAFEEEPPVVVCEPDLAWCDACTLTIKEAHDRYGCQDRCHFNFCLCTECYDRGTRCIDPSHQLVLKKGDQKSS